MAIASVLCSASIIEFTIPQVVRLSQASQHPLAAAPLFPTRAALFGRMIAPQAAITLAQFALVRELRGGLDRAVGPSALNLPVAYGAASVPFIAAKYNLIISSVYSHSGRTPPAALPWRETPLRAAAGFWKRNIAPGLAWSLLRDTGSVGGGIVLGPVVSRRLADATGSEAVTAPHRFAGGLLAGSCTGLATQLFHNTALTAGRMAEAGGSLPGTAECMRRVLAEHGAKALYVNFQWRVAIIALWTAILNATDPFAVSR